MSQLDPCFLVCQRQLLKKYRYQQLIEHTVPLFEQMSRTCLALIVSRLDYQKPVQEKRGGFCTGQRRQVSSYNFPRHRMGFAAAKAIIASRAAYEYIFSVYHEE
jgi:hypothetical protein